MLHEALVHQQLRLLRRAGRERVLFIGTQFSNLYTTVDTTARGRVGVVPRVHDPALVSAVTMSTFCSNSESIALMPCLSAYPDTSCALTVASSSGSSSCSKTHVLERVSHCVWPPAGAHGHTTNRHTSHPHALATTHLAQLRVGSLHQRLGCCHAQPSEFNCPSLSDCLDPTCGLKRGATHHSWLLKVQQPSHSASHWTPKRCLRKGRITHSLRQLSPPRPTQVRPCLPRVPSVLRGHHSVFAHPDTRMPKSQVQDT